MICKHCQSGGDVEKIITKLYNTATKAAVLTEALEGRMSLMYHPQMSAESGMLRCLSSDTNNKYELYLHATIIYKVIIF